MTNATERSVKGVLGEKLGMTQVWDADEPPRARHRRSRPAPAS